MFTSIHHRQAPLDEQKRAIFLTCPHARPARPHVADMLPTPIRAHSTPDAKPYF